MIKTLKTFAVAMLATGATVTAANAAKTTYSATNVLQTVGVTLTVYEQKPVSTPTVATGSFKTKDLITAVESALGTNGTFDKKAELAILTSNLVTEVGTTNVTTNVVTSVPNTLVVSSNVYLIAGTNGQVTNLVIGDTNIGSSIYVTITAANGSTNNVVVTTAGINGPVNTTNSATNLTLDANQTLAIGTNAAFSIETNLALGAAAEGVDPGVVAILTNGVVITNLAIGTNSVTFTLTNVTIGTGTNEIVSFPTNAVVEITNANPPTTNVIYGGSPTNAVGFATDSSFQTSLTTRFAVAATNGLTNVTVLTTTTDLVTNTVTVTNVVPVYTTNESSELVIADGTVNTPIPTNILYVAEIGTNDIVGETSKTETDWSIKKMELNTIAVFTNATDIVTLKVQGLVHSTFDDFAVGKSKVAVTNEAWTDVSGIGTNNGTPIVVGGTITVGSPTEQKIPNP